MSQPASEKVTVSCSCGARLKVPAHAAGKRVKCPKCASVITVPTPEAVMAGASPESDWLDDLASAENSAPAADIPRPTRPAGGPSRSLGVCAKCGVAMPGGAVLCTNCGYNAQTGRVTKLARTTSTAGESAVKAAQLAGTFLLGCVLCVVGAAIGGAVWFIVAMQTGYEVGYIAWGLGGLAGLGMAFGSRRSGFMPGVISTGVAVLAIIGAKILIFATVVFGVVVEEMKSELVDELAMETLLKEGISDDIEAQRDRIWAEAEARVESMSAEEMQAEYQRLQSGPAFAAYEDEPEAPAEAGGEGLAAGETADDELNDEEYDEGEEEYAYAPEPTAQEAAHALATGFFALMFGWIDILFLGLAIVTAYKVGSSGLEFG